jgi:DnaJ family protein B protein 12
MMFYTVVSRAFQVLSDADKKSRYDKFGGDPDNRFSSSGGGASSGASPFSGFAQQRRGGFEEEISPEELFRQFFGGGGMGGPFGGLGGGGFGGPGFVFNMGGGPGVRVHQFGGNRPRRRPQDANAPQQPTSPLQALQGLLPLLLLFILPLLSSLFGGSDSTSRGPQMRFDKAVPPHTLSHTSNRLNVPYWVNPTEVQDYNAKKWKELDKVAEGKFVQQINAECEWEVSKRQRMAQDAQGFFFTDHEMLNKARKMEMPSCKKLEALGYRIPRY